MNMKKGLVVLAAVLCVCVGSQVYAKDYDKPTTGQQSMMRQGSDLINSQIMNDKGNELGRVSDVVYDRNGNPQYLIMSQAGKMYPIPYSSVTVDRTNRRVTLRDFDRNKLEQAPYFSENERNKLGESGFDKKVYGYYGTQYPSTAPQLDQTWESQYGTQEKAGAGHMPGHPESGTGKYSTPTEQEKSR